MLIAKIYISNRILTIIIGSLLLVVNACMDERREKKANECLNDECILKFCPNYDVESNEIIDKDNTICNQKGACLLPSMPLYSQLNSNVPAGEIACGPTSVAMAIDSAISNSSKITGGWTKKFAVINATSDPTATASVCPATDIECKKIVATGSELIDGTWSDSGAYEVYSREVNDFWSNRKSDFSSSTSFDTGDYPNTVDKCAFVTGETAINNSDAWVNVVLYLKYASTISSKTQTESGIPITFLSVDSESITGHYIALNGFDATGSELFHKFHDPTLGYKWYALKEIEVGEKSCVKWSSNNECLQYIALKNLPAYFEDKVTYLIEISGEELQNRYQFKFIANIGGFKPK